LAAACLECLVDKGAATVATTHYEALKELANGNSQFCNAAVGFDVETMMPSFRLIAGVAGPSTAFAVAKRFGIPDQVLTRAGALIPKSSHERETLLEQLSAEREAARVLREDAAKEAEEQRRLRVLMDSENEQARATFERKLEQEYRELLGQVRIARTELDNLRKRVIREAETPHELTRGTLTQLERSLDSAAHVVALGSPVANAVSRYRAPQANKSLTLDEIEVGKIVHLPRLNASAQVVEISRKGTLKVRVGNVVMQTVLAEIEVAAKEARQPRQQAQTRAINKPKPRASHEPALPRGAPMRMTRNTLDLRGERVDAALDRVDAFVDELLKIGEPAGYVLHGHGTGALKQAVREHVRTLRHVAESGPAAPEDGGDAFTLLWLSD
jgi:DNA mismatch repair protein MutS2